MNSLFLPSLYHQRLLFTTPSFFFLWITFQVFDISQLSCPARPVRPEAQTSNQIWILANYLEFGSLHHPSSCMSIHRTAAPAAILMVPSIKKPSKCAISSFSFSHLFLVYTHPGSICQEPGQHFSQISYLLFRTLLGNSRRARRGTNPEIPFQ